MPIVELSGRSSVRVSGAEAEHFLQNLITTDLAQLAAGEARAGALLTPQGKIMFDFLVSRDGSDGFRLECDAGAVADLARRLTIYKLRARVEIAVEDQHPVMVAWGSDSIPSQNDSGGNWLRDRRFADEPVFRARDAAEAATANGQDWHRLRIEHGIAESGHDFALGDAFPHDAGLDQMGGVGLRKGCYVGQEVVSRMHHRGTARRRVLIASAASDLPASGTAVEAGGRPLGTLGTVVGGKGLAIARIDRVKSAMDAGVPLLADGTAVELAIPPSAGFTFPQTDEGQDGA